MISLLSLLLRLSLSSYKSKAGNPALAAASLITCLGFPLGHGTPCITLSTTRFSWVEHSANKRLSSPKLMLIFLLLLGVLFLKALAGLYSGNPLSSISQRQKA